MTDFNYAEVKYSIVPSLSVWFVVESLLQCFNAFQLKIPGRCHRPSWIASLALSCRVWRLVTGDW